MDEKSGTTVLIVEDEGLIALEMMEFLSHEGYHVLEPAASGEEAVERCCNSPQPDLILMDIHLAGKIDGIEATRRIREHYPVPVIILTAADDNQTVKRIREVTPRGYLIKPATRQELLTMISLVLESCPRQEKMGMSAGMHDNRSRQTDQ